MSRRYAESEADAKYYYALYGDPRDVYAAYCRNTCNYAETLTKLLTLEAYDKALSLLETELQGASPGDEKFEQLSGILLKATQKARKQEILAPFIMLYTGMLTKQRAPAQVYAVCAVLSELVARNRTFLTKSHAISYFKVLLRLFKLSASFPSYLNALHYLTTLEGVELTSEEVVFLKKCAALKPEPVQKSLFCGLSPVDEDEVLKKVPLTGSSFIEDPNWLKLIELKEAGSSAPFDLPFLSFLLKNGFEVEISEDGRIRPGVYKYMGLANRLFDIARCYEEERKVEVPQVRAKKPIEEKVRPEKRAEEATPIKKKSSHTFADRFKRRAIAFRWYYSQLANEFHDEHFEERKRFVEKRFADTKARLEARQMICRKRVDTVRELTELLSGRVAAARETARLEDAARQAELAAQRAAEEKSKKWNTSRLARQETKVAEAPSSTQRPVVSWGERRVAPRQPAPGFYRPPPATLSETKEEMRGASTSTEGKWARGMRRSEK